MMKKHMQFVAAFIKYNFMYSVFSHFKLQPLSRTEGGESLSNVWCETCILRPPFTASGLRVAVQDETLMCAHTASARL